MTTDVQTISGKNGINEADQPLVDVLREAGVTIYIGIDHNGPWWNGPTETEEKLGRMVLQERAGVTPVEALFAFCAWLTTHHEPTTFSARHEAATAIERIREFCISQGWDIDSEVAENYTDKLKPYPRDLSVPTSER